MHENKLYYRLKQGDEGKKEGRTSTTLHLTIQPPIDQKQEKWSKSLVFDQNYKEFLFLWGVSGIPDTHHKLDSKAQRLASSKLVNAVCRWNPLGI